MTLWLLDTNTVSDIIRNPRGRVRRKISQVGANNVCTSIVVACELRFGAAKRGTVQMNERIDQALYALDVQPPSEDADRHYARCAANSNARERPSASTTC